MLSDTNFLLGIDQGTTNIKGIIIDEGGNVVASASAPCHTVSPSIGLYEQDPDEVWSSCVTILKKLTETAGPSVVSRIRGISISSQVISLLPVDSHGDALRNVIIYQDSRSANELDRILNTVGFNKFVTTVGGQPSVAFLSNKIMWYKENEPELFAKTAAILQVNGYLNFKLTGVLSQDADCASRTQCYNVSDMSVADVVADAVGADFSKILPAPVDCTEIIGHVTPEAAALTGLLEGTPVVAGCSDAMASMYATGMSALGDAGESSGTTSLLFVGSDVKSAPDVPVVTRPCYIKGVPYLFDAPIGSTGASLKWYLSTIGKIDEEEAAKLGINVYDYLSNVAMDTPAGSEGLLFLPYLVAGERAPLWNSHARGMFIGLTIGTTRAHMIRSVFEGTAFALRHVMTTVKASGAKATSLRVTGGGSNSPAWNRIKASMLNMPVYTLDAKSGDVPFGDCLLAGVGTGVFTDLTASLKNMISIKERFDPIPEWTEVYDKLYPYYVEMYAQLDKTLVRYKNTVDSIK